jgi:hypothetical protein
MSDANALPSSPGRLLVLPVAVTMQLIWALTIHVVRGPALEQFGEGVRYPLGLMTAYGGAFIIIYAAARGLLWFRSGHLAASGDFRVLGFSLRNLYYRTGLNLVDSAGLFLSVLLAIFSLLVEPLAMMAPFAIFGIIAFFSGLMLGTAAPWPTRRRGRE